MKRNVSERRQFFHITEADVFIPDIAKNACTVAAIGNRDAGVTDPGYKPRLRFFVQNIKDAFARCEFLVDRYMASHPLSALCGYGLALGNDTVREFALLHTLGRSNEAPLQVFGCADGAIGLTGGCDPVDVATLGRVLPRLRIADGPALVVDMAGVEQVDHRLLLTLDRYARENGVALSLRSAPPLAARLMELLPVSSLQLANSGAQG